MGYELASFPGSTPQRFLHRVKKPFRNASDKSWGGGLEMRLGTSLTGANLELLSGKITLHERRAFCTGEKFKTRKR